MKLFNGIFFTLTVISGYSQVTGKPLFQIFENGATGFIDTNGQIAINPVFRTAGEFSEGLAPARVNGTYGYIDASGNFVIPPQFDYATPFSEGLALVYKYGKPFFINRQGQKPFEINFPAMGAFENGRAAVETGTKRAGFIDKTGRLIIDTAFASLNPFIHGMAIVTGINHHPYSNPEKGIKKNYEAGVIDTLGHFIIPYGKYQEISDFENGYFRVEIPAEPWDTIEGDTKRTGFIDKKGDLIFARDHKNNCWMDGNVHCGLIRMSLYKYWAKEEKGVTYSSNNSYEGFINLKGELVLNDTNYERVRDFSDNRAFVQNDNRDLFIINTQGKLISKDTFSGIIGEGFRNGLAFVEKDDRYGLIDTNANFVIKPRFKGISEAGILDGYFFFFDWDTAAKSEYERLYGIAKTDGSILLDPVMGQFDGNGFRNGLLRCIIKGKLAFINKAGKIVWQETGTDDKQLKNLNIDFMNRGYFYAHSKPDKKDLGGFGRSDNSAREISGSDKFPERTLSVVVRPDVTDTIDNTYNGITVFVANTSKREVGFNAQDSRLYMKVQAKDSKGEWKDIEYLPSSWCGNSYHTLTLERNHYWTFLTPVYEGDFKTKLRVELKYIDPSDKSEKRWNRKEITLYSNEYDGSVNPGQFWRKRDYYPHGIMDPYND